MRRFFRPADIAALIAVALVAVPLTNRLAAQELHASNADSVVVARDSVTPTIDLRAVQRQALGPVAASVSRAQVPLGASMSGLRSAVHTRDNVGPLVVSAAAKNANLGQAQALMIVGAAALITGAIIGDDPGTIIMVGGAVIGLYGLYQYLQ